MAHHISIRRVWRNKEGGGCIMPALSDTMRREKKGNFSIEWCFWNCCWFNVSNQIHFGNEIDISSRAPVYGLFFSFSFFCCYSCCCCLVTHSWARNFNFEFQLRYIYQDQGINWGKNHFLNIVNIKSKIVSCIYIRDMKNEYIYQGSGSNRNDKRKPFSMKCDGIR